jgi:hypothetical protein
VDTTTPIHPSIPLSPRQVAAIKTPADQPSLILAGAGTSGSKTKRISGSGFLEFCDIKPQKNISCPAEWNAEVGAIVVDLREGLKPGK